MGKRRCPARARRAISLENRTAPSTHAASTLNKCGPAEHGGCMEQQDVRRASIWRRVRAGSGKDDSARPHQANQHDKDR
jgi:hypothetical protein